MKKKSIALIVIALILAGCTRSYNYGQIPLYRQYDSQKNIMCYLQTGDSIRVHKKKDSMSLVQLNESCQGWISSSMIDSLVFPIRRPKMKLDDIDICDWETCLENDSLQ